MNVVRTGDSIRCAVVGYGPAHSFGRQHGCWIQAATGLEWVAVCDQDPDRLKAAAVEFPFMKTVNDFDCLLQDPAIDMVSIITPHHTHRDLVVRAARAGKHVVVEKAMALSVAECDEMIDAAREAGVTLAVSHLRRHDAVFQTLKETIDGGELGEIVEIELNLRSFTPPVPGWYSCRELSGGALFYWGPHAIDWILQLMPGRRVTSVTGFSQHKVWKEVNVADHTRAILRFDNGTCADIGYSRIDASSQISDRPVWRIQGTKGAAVEQTGHCRGLTSELIGPAEGALTMVTTDDNREFTVRRVAHGESHWGRFYQEMADCLLHGTRVPVSGEDGRRTIAVMEAAEKSARNDTSEPVKYEMELSNA